MATSDHSDVSDPPPLRSSLQMHYDTLAEMIKFNPRIFHRLYAAVGPQNMPAFLTGLQSSLVDSNVVLRAVILALEHRLQGNLIAQAVQGACPTCEMQSAMLNLFSVAVLRLVRPPSMRICPSFISGDPAPSPCMVTQATSNSGRRHPLRGPFSPRNPHRTQPHRRASLSRGRPRCGTGERHHRRDRTLPCAGLSVPVVRRARSASRGGQGGGRGEGWGGEGHGEWLRCVAGA